MSADTKRLLGRGGRALGLAALAHARGQRPGRGPWHVLAPEMVKAAEELLLVLDQGLDPALVETAIQAAMSRAPATAAPGWAAPLGKQPGLLDKIGQAIDPEEIGQLVGVKGDAVPTRTRGLAALAIALCRNPDTLAAFCDKLEGQDKEELAKMGSLAQCVVSPGAPSRMRTRLRRLISKELEHGSSGQGE